MAIPFGQPSLDALPSLASAEQVQGGGMNYAGFDPSALMAQSMLAPEERQPESAIDKLKPDSDEHKKVLAKLNAMFDYSANAMRQHHPRWLWQEQKIQAYIKLPDYKQMMDTLANNNGAAPEPIQLVMPYSFATIHAAATFIYSVLAGRRPVFPLLATRGTAMDKARYMEAAVQSNIEMSKGYEALWQFIWDSLIYSFGAVRIGWAEERGSVLSIRNGNREINESLKFAGNKILPIDPYAFFPDPRVPMSEVNTRGDFVFWITHQSKMILQDREKLGHFKWVDAACTAARAASRDPSELGPVSNRRARIGTNGTLLTPPQDIIGFLPIREGTVRLVPKDWGLGDRDTSQIWKFTWVKDQIIQAQPLNMAHDKHPVAVCEPVSFGHEFGAMALGDFIAPFQDLLSWLVNSRMENVRTTINNQFVVDPFRVEMQDLRQPAPGKAIRLKQSAIGTPVDEAIKQLVTTDVTQGHIADIQVLRLLADTVTGVNDNMRGIQTPGGRKSATEARISMQAGAGRLSQLAVRISSQGMGDIVSQMLMNIQQFMPQDMWIEMTGDEGPESCLIHPDMIVGTFNYQVSDGSLPYDKTALLEVWKEIMFGIAADPELRAGYDINKIFEHVAVLGGAKNIASFKKQLAQPGFAPGQPPSGTVPAGPAMPQMPFQGGPQLALPAPQ